MNTGNSSDEARQRGNATGIEDSPIDPLEAEVHEVNGVLRKFTLALIADYHGLRAGKITVTEARARAQLAREAIRAVHLQLQGARMMEAKAKEIGPGTGGSR